MLYVVGGLSLIALILVPPLVRWPLALLWPAAAGLLWARPDDRPANVPYLLMGQAGVSLLIIAHAIVLEIGRGSPEPYASTMWSIGNWLLGIAAMLAIGIYAFILRFIFWDRQTPIFSGRETAEDVIGRIKRQ